MTGIALNLALKTVVRHDELNNVKHGVPLDIHVVVSGTQILFHWIGLKMLTNIILVFASYPEIPPTYKRRKNRRTALGFTSQISLLWFCSPA